MSYYKNLVEIRKLQSGTKIPVNKKLSDAEKRIQASEVSKKRKWTADNWREKLAGDTQAIGDKLSLQNIPGVGKHIPDILDITGGIGNMASALGAAPLNAQKSKSNVAYVKAIGKPLLIGAFAGSVQGLARNLGTKAGGRVLSEAAPEAAQTLLGAGSRSALAATAGGAATTAGTSLATTVGLNALSSSQFPTIAAAIGALGISAVADKYFGGDHKKAITASAIEEINPVSKLIKTPGASSDWKKATTPINPVTLVPVKDSTSVTTDTVSTIKAKEAAAKAVAENPAVKNSTSAPTAGSSTSSATGSSSSSRAGRSHSVSKASGKGNSQADKIIRFQRTLGVKPDGIWGPKTQAAFEKVKATQEGLGFTGKDVDGIRGAKTKAAINARFDAAGEQVRALEAPATYDRSKDPMVVVQPTRTDREMRQEARRLRREMRQEKRELKRLSPEDKGDFAFKKGGILYGCR